MLWEPYGTEHQPGRRDSKLTDLDRLTTRRTTIHLGMPTLDRLVSRSATPADNSSTLVSPVPPNAERGAVDQLLRPQRTQAVVR